MDIGKALVEYGSGDMALEVGPDIDMDGPDDHHNTNPTDHHDDDDDVIDGLEPTATGPAMGAGPLQNGYPHHSPYGMDAMETEVIPSLDSKIGLGVPRKSDIYAQLEHAALCEASKGSKHSKHSKKAKSSKSSNITAESRKLSEWMEYIQQQSLSSGMNQGALYDIKGLFTLHIISSDFSF